MNVVKKLLAFLCFVPYIACAQVGIHKRDQPWTPTMLNQLQAAGLYNQTTKQLAIDSFEYTVDPGYAPYNPGTWMIQSGKLAVAKTWTATSGVTVVPLFRCTRTIGTATVKNGLMDCETIPMDTNGQAWWAWFVFQKVLIANRVNLVVGTWNEQSLHWDPASTDPEQATRPERQAACVDKLVQLIKTTGRTDIKLLVPSIPSPWSSNDLLYLTRFFAALPYADLAYVAPDCHLYPSCSWKVVNGFCPTTNTYLAQLISKLSAFGYGPGDIYFSEVGTSNLYGGVTPTSQQSADCLAATLTTLKQAGVKLPHCYVWTDETVPFWSLFTGTGTLTPYGTAVQKGMQP